MAVAQRYAALVLPRFRLQAVRLALGEPEDAACKEVGILDGDSSRGILLEVSPEAEVYGITPGMASTQALARCAHIRLLAASRSAEDAVLQKLLSFVESLSPRVEKRARDLWLLDLRGIQPPDSSWPLWAERALRRLLEQVRLSGRLGIAPGTGLAWCAAFRANPVRVVEEPESFIEALQFRELGVSSRLQQQLHDWGLSTLGDLLRLPRQATIERLGAEAATLWELARDSRESVLRLESFPEPLEIETAFEQPLESVAPVLFALNRILEQLCSRMRLLQRVASAMYLELQLEDGSAHLRQFTIPAPTREESVLLRILDTHLETLHFESPLVGVLLRMEAVTPSSQQLALFENPLRDPNRFGETVARLRALVGDEWVGVPVLGHTYRPNTFTLKDPVEMFSKKDLREKGPPPPSLPQAARKGPLGLPLRRFRPPLSVQVELEKHRPLSVCSDSVRGPVLESRGPYRLSGDWWDRERWILEEWDICLGGSKQGLYRLGCHVEATSTEWFLEGCYDTSVWPLTQIPPPRER
ncbi:MAG: DNA polymerase Y family protein [Verrucomicrobiota bacterium]